MIEYIGVDGCRAGWFGVGFWDGDKWDIGVFKDIDSLWKWCYNARLILIDIPIGLMDGGSRERTCDIEARRILGKRGSSIFRVPCRAVLKIKSYKDACLINKQLTGKSISKQAWHIIPKIRQVDRFIRRYRDVPIRETHPEICFWALAGHPMRYSKKTIQGYRERLVVLRSVLIYVDDIIEEAKRRYFNKDLAMDDILDALVIAIVARMGMKRLVSIPKRAEFDSFGLRMEIVCAMP